MKILRIIALAAMLAIPALADIGPTGMAFDEHFGMGEYLYYVSVSAGGTVTTTYYYSGAATWTNSAPGTVNWYTTNDWSAGLIPYSSTTSKVTFFADTTAANLMPNSLTINGDPATFSCTNININGTTSNTLTIGTPGKGWYMGGNQLNYLVCNTTNAGNGSGMVVFNPDMVLSNSLNVVGTGNVSNGLWLAGSLTGTGYVLAASSTFPLVLSGNKSMCAGVNVTKSLLFSGNNSIPSNIWASAGATIDATNADIVSANTSTFNMANSWTFPGSYNLNLGPGGVLVPVSGKTLTCSAKDFTARTISGGGLMIKDGTGTLSILTNGLNHLMVMHGTVSFDSNNAFPSVGIAVTNSPVYLDNSGAGGAVSNAANCALAMANNYTLQFLCSSGNMDMGTNYFATYGSAVAISCNTNKVILRGPIYYKSGTIWHLAGAGMFELWGTNAGGASATIIIDAGGTVSFCNGAAFPASTLTVSAGAYFDNTSGAPVINSLNGPVTLLAGATYLGSTGGYLDLGTGTVSMAASFTHAAGTLVCHGPVIDTVTVNLYGAGKLELDCYTNLFNGTTVSFYVNLQGTGGIYQASSRNINIGAGGVVRPGTNGYAGALGFAKLTHSSGATNIFNLVSTSVYGQIVAIPTSGTATINLTNAKIVVNDANGTFAQNDVVTIVSIGSYTLSGTYSGQAQGSTVSGSKYNWTISYTGGAGHDVTLTRQ